MSTEQRTLTHDVANTVCEQRDHVRTVADLTGETPAL